MALAPPNSGTGRFQLSITTQIPLWVRSSLQTKSVFTEQRRSGMDWCGGIEMVAGRWEIQTLDTNFHTPSQAYFLFEKQHWDALCLQIHIAYHKQCAKNNLSKSDMNLLACQGASALKLYARALKDLLMISRPIVENALIHDINHTKTLQSTTTTCNCYRVCQTPIPDLVTYSSPIRRHSQFQAHR